jgi:oligoendopeptidase F
MSGDTRYSSESILVHELGHAVMSIGMEKEQAQRVEEVGDSA